MKIRPGLTGVIDNPELFQFLRDNRKHPRVWFLEAPFTAKNRPTMMAVDPTAEGTLEKTLSYINDAPYEMFWFAVLPTCDPQQVALAAGAGAQAIFFRDVWEEASYINEFAALGARTHLLFWKLEMAWHARHEVHPMSTKEPHVLSHALLTLNDLMMDWQETATILICWNGSWSLPYDSEVPLDLETFKEAIEVYGDRRGFHFFEEPFPNNYYLGLSFCFQSGPLKVLFASVSDQTDDELFDGELEWIQEGMTAIHRSFQGITVPYFKTCIRELEQIQMSMDSGRLINFVETCTGVMDLYGSRPGASLYNLGMLQKTLRARTQLCYTIQGGRFYLVPEYLKGLVDTGQECQPHQLWQQSRQHYLFGQGEHPLGTLHYDGPSLAFNIPMSIALTESFVLFRHLAQAKGLAAEVWLELKSDDHFWCFEIRNKLPRVSSLQRQAWFQPFAMEHVQLMIYESSLLLQQCGGALLDMCDAMGKEGNGLRLQIPKEPESSTVYMDWHASQIPFLDRLDHDNQEEEQAHGAYYDQQMRSLDS